MKLGKYKHYKGNVYEVIGVGRDSDSHERMVIYRATYDSKEFGDKAFWVKSLNGFSQNVELNGETVSRFKYLEE